MWRPVSTRDESSVDPEGITSYDLPSNLKGDYSAIHHASMDVHNDDLYVTWVGPDREIRLARRRFTREFEPSINLSEVSSTVFSSQWTLDSHNYMAVGVSNDGIIHVAGDMHAVPLKYMRSTNPGDLVNWSTGMVGSLETQCTYPHFFRSKAGNFFFWYRTGGSGDGDWVLNKWNETARTWSRVATVIQGTVDNNNAYPHQIVVDPTSGAWYCFFTIRDDFTGPEYNHDIYFMKSLDEGVTWRKTDGTAYTLPITVATAEQIVDIPGGLVDGMNILNGGQSAVGVDGRPNSVWIVEDASNIYRYRHVWLDPDDVTWHYDTLMPTTNSSGRTPGLIIWPDGRRWMVFQNGAGGRGNTLRYYDIDAQTETVIRDTNMIRYLPCIFHSRTRGVAYILAPYEYQDGIDGAAPGDIADQPNVPVIALR